MNEDGRSTCHSLERSELDDIDRYQCLIAKQDELSGCNATWLAFNQRMFFRPFRIRRTAVYAEKPSRLIYDATTIKKFCTK
jgi:hypothetical protein